MKNIIPLAIVVVIVFLLLGNQQTKYTNKFNSKIVSVNSQYDALDYNTVDEFNDALKCLTLNIYMEAGIETVQGKLAVGVVTVNRLNSKKYGETMCRVVYAKNQFSWTMNTPKNILNLKNTNKAQYKESEEIAKKILIEKFYLDSLKSSLHYHADYISTPIWAKNKRRIIKIGRHIFYEN